MKDPHKEFDLWLKVFRKSRPEQEISNAFSALLEVIKKMNDEIELLKANSRLNYMDKLDIMGCGLLVLFTVSLVFVGKNNIELDKKQRAEKETLTLTNQQIVEKSKYCIDNGLNAELVYTGNHYGKYVSDILCNPEENPLVDIEQGKKSQSTVILNQ